MPLTRLPPLSTLPVLEAAARLRSYVLAAEELHVTQSAVSHQIRSLESHLGVKLFVRHGRGVVPTAEGSALAERVRRVLQDLGAAVEAVSPAARAGKLKISVLPSFGSRWLMPRLSRFLERHPDIQISVEATQARANFLTDDVDVAIRYGNGPWPGLHSERIAGDSLLAVCSRQFRGGRLPKKPAELAKLPLYRADPQQWKSWFAAAKLDCQLPMQGIEYNDATHFIEEALAGKGIVLARRSLVHSDLEAKRLVHLFGIELPGEFSYYLVCLPQHRDSPKIAAFRQWIMSEIDWPQLAEAH